MARLGKNNSFPSSAFRKRINSVIVTAVLGCGIVGMIPQEFPPEAVAESETSPPAPVEVADYSNKELHYTLRLPSGWIVIPKVTIDAVQNQVAMRTGAPLQLYAAGFQKKADKYFNHPYLLIQHRMAPNIDLETLAASSKQGDLKTVDKSFREAGIAKTVDFGQVVIDKDHDALISKMAMELPVIGKIAATVAILPGRDGIVQINFYSRAENEAAEAELFQTVLDSFRFDYGYGYSPLGAKQDMLLQIGGGVALLLLVFLLVRIFRSKKEDESPAPLPS